MEFNYNLNNVLTFNNKYETNIINIKQWKIIY